MMEEKALTPEGKKWLHNIWNSKRLESESGACPDCGRKAIEIQVWEFADGTIKKYKNCPTCIAKRDKMRKEEEEVIRLAEVAKMKLQYRKTCGIPAKFMNQDFSTFKKGWQDKAFDYCWKYANSFPVDKRPIGIPSLYIQSKSFGTGKTHLSCAIVHRIIDRWNGGDRGCPRIIFASEPDFFRAIQTTYSFNNEEQKMRESEDDIIKRLTYCDLLILDDVGKEERRDLRFLQRTLFALIDGRYRLEVPMVLTANLNADQLKTHLGDAAFDRFFEMIKGSQLEMEGKSYRRQ